MNTEIIPFEAFKKLDQLTVVKGSRDCWPYLSNAKSPRIWANGKAFYPRRLAFIRARGPILDGLCVQVTCRNPKCLNPNHLYAAPPRATTDSNIRERFYAKIHFTPTCHIWMGSRDHQGYGVFRFKGRQVKAHRVRFIIEGGVLPKSRKAMLCHACNNKLCVRIDPEHVRLGDGYLNAADREKAGTTARGDRNGSRTCPESLKRGVENGRAELTEADVHCIRNTAAAYKGQRGVMAALARRFNKDERTIKDIIHRKLWKHLPPSQTVQPLAPEEVAKIPIHGESSIFTKVTDLQVREIRFLYHQAGGRYGTLSRLEKRYPIGRSQLLRLALRESRVEIEDDFHSLPALEPLFPSPGVVEQQ